MVILTMFPKEFDFSEIENQRFECQEGCGRCCFYQFVFLTTTEVSNIISCLRKRSREEFEEFIWDWMSSAGKLIEYDEENFQKRKNTLLNFYFPSGIHECKEAILIRNYLLHTLRPTGRCVFLNPITAKCFIYEARPTTCRLYPFTTSIEEMKKTKFVVAFPQCPGLARGKPIDFDEMKKVHLRQYSYIKKDFKLLKKFMRDQKLTEVNARARSKGKFKKMTKEIFSKIEDEWRREYFLGEGKPEQLPKKKIIDPFVESGIVPSTFLTEAIMNLMRSKMEDS